MKTFTVAAATHDFASVLASLADGNQEVVLLDGEREVAHLIAQPSPLRLEDLFADPEDGMGEEAGAALEEAVEKVRNHPGNRLTAQRAPWAG